MNQMPLFLRWVLITVLTIAASVVGAVVYLDHVEHPGTGGKVALAIFGVFAVMNSYCGWLMWQSDRGDYETRAKVEHDAEHVWFAVSVLQILGLLGTVIGFLIAMVGGFANLDASDQASVERLLTHIAEGSATALLATLVGIFTSIVLALQHHILTDSLRR